MKKALKFTKTASSRLQNQINISIIYNYLRQNDPISRARISENLGISAPAVSRVIEKLINEDYVIETEKPKTKSGKRPTLITINKQKGFIIAIDLGKENLKIALCNFAGQVIERHEGFKIQDDAQIIKKVISEINLFLKKISMLNAEYKNQLKAICIGIPADVDTATGAITSAPLYSSWEKINFKQRINQELKIPVYIENDVNLSALGEKHSESEKEFNDIIFIEISNGIGAGLIIDNNLHRGTQGAAGEIGFSIINESNLEYSFKSKGFLEKYASIDSIKQQMISRIKEGRHSKILETINGDFEKIEPFLVCEFAYNNDLLSKEIIDRVSSFLTVTILNATLLINPQKIILGGDICKMPYVDELFLEPIISKIKNLIPFNPPIIELSVLGEDACLIGAAFVAIESLLMEEFPYKIEH